MYVQPLIVDTGTPNPPVTGGPRHICTMADSGYLHFVLALHASMRDHCSDWTLHVMCLDELALDVLEQVDRPGLSPMPFADLLELEPMLQVARDVRPLGQYARGCKPFAIRRVLADPARPSVVTWLDADAMFFAGFDPVLDELGSSSILLAPQGVPPAFRHVEERTGRFMGGLVSFRNDETGRAAVEWWATRCLVGGCPRIPDAIRFGDQKYLQGIPERFAGVRITSEIALFLAPFNIEGHTITSGADGPRVDGKAVVLYQYTGFHEIEGGGYEASFPPWRLTRSERRTLYEPFRARIAEARRELTEIAPRLGDFAIPRRGVGERLTGIGSRTKGMALRGRQALRGGG